MCTKYKPHDLEQPDTMGKSYWTSGIYVGDECKHLDFPYVWCPTKEILSKNLMWRSGEPNISKGLCIAIQIGGKRPGLFMEKCDLMKSAIAEILPDFFESKLLCV
jgi:hypothetical protein